MNNILKLLAPIKKHKGRYLVYILISIFYGIIWPIQSVIVSKIIANVEHKNIQGLQNYAIAFLVIILIIYGTMYSMRNFRRNTKRIFQEEVYHKYLHKYLTADNNQIEILGTGQANSIFQRGCESRNNFINGIVIESGTRILTLFTAIIAIVWIYLGWQTLLICLVVFFIIFGISLRGTIRMKTIRKGRRESFIQMDRSIIKVIMSKFEILQNGKSAKEVNTIGKYVKELKQRDMKESVGYIYGSDIGKFIIDITKRGFIVRYGIRIFNGQSNFSEFTLIWMMLNQLSGVLFEASDIIINSSDQITYIQKLQDTFENIPKIKGYEEGKDFAFKQGDIRINNVHFSYGDKQVLNQFSLDITGGYKTAFVGQSGTGKTTLLKLLAGYVHPNTGSIEVDGQNLQDIALKSYYTNIGYLTQDPNVFDGTVIENLLYGTKTKPTKKKIKDAIEGAQCHFIYEFKDQLETQIGEKGVRLSGGQKQRLAIAKLFLKNPHIILLDEPTSALDSFSEEEITKALNNLFIGRTVIVAAHRLQTVKKADQIIVLGDHGNIIEKGNHQELVEKKGTYYNMIELQSGF